MEREELIKMVQLYKTRLANTEEEAISYQVIISKQVQEKDEMRQQIENLQNQVNELLANQNVSNTEVE